MTDYVRPYASKSPVAGVLEDGNAVFLANPSDGSLYALGSLDAVAVLSHLGINDIDTPERHWEILASKEGAIHIADGSDVAIGAKADAAAGTDTGTFTLIALIKRMMDTHLKVIKTNTTGVATDAKLDTIVTNTAATALESGGVLDTIKTGVDGVALESGGNLDTLVAAIGAVSAAAWNLTDASTTVIALLKECALLLNDIKTNTTV